MRKHWVGCSEPLALTRQCELTGVARSGVYAPRVVAPPDVQELTLLGLIDAEYTRHPFYGSRKIGVHLRGLGHTINRKPVQRLMGVLGSRAWRRARTPVVRIRSTKCIRTCCAVWMSSAPITCGARILLTSAWHMDLFTGWP